MSLFFRLVTSDSRTHPAAEFRQPSLGVSGNVFGPFESIGELNHFATNKWPNEKDYKLLVFEAQLFPIVPTGKELPEERKRKPDPKNYELGPDGKTLVCKSCKATILAADVAHPIWVSEGAGFGECKNERVPFCPNCDKRPSFHGHPVREDGSPW